MAYQDQPVRETITTERQVDTAADVRDQMRDERPVTPRDDHRMNVAERFIWLIAGIIMGLLALRFLLRLLGANPNNGFADFIYSISQPFAAPFFGLFNYDADLGAGRFEFETLIAILIYALIAWVLAKLVTLGKR
ncbi:MAG: YggT family protein [Candidatus Saccharimonadales bacterium]|jgi:uncharacterized protein YggT (Ycf19 family)